MSTYPKFNLDGHHQVLHVSFREGGQVTKDIPKCSYQEMWESVVALPSSPPPPESYLSMLEAVKKAPLPRLLAPAPNTPVFKDFTPVQMLEKVHEYVAAGWRRGDLGAWHRKEGLICLMGGVWRFLAREVLNTGHTPNDNRFIEATHSCKPLLEGLRTFAQVIHEQHPELRCYPSSIESMNLDQLSRYIINYNDGVATGPEAVCALLEKAMVRELERV